VLVGVVRFAPRAEHPLHKLIAPPPDCVAPCWQGIRPAVTRYQEAVALLEANPNIVSIDTRQTLVAESRQYAWYIYWTWDDHSGEPMTGSLMIQENIVQIIRINEQIPFGQLWSILGTPEQGLFVGSLTFRNSQPFALPLYQIALYPQIGVTVRAGANCANYWWELSTLTIGMFPVSGGHHYDLSAYRRYACKGWQPGAT